jgi:hypothetical protein
VSQLADNNESVIFEPKDTVDLAHFFKTGRDRYHEIWIIIMKKEVADPQPVSFADAVNEAVKQGLIDSRTKTLNEQKYMIRFTKRKREKKPAKPEK